MPKRKIGCLPWLVFIGGLTLLGGVVALAVLTSGSSGSPRYRVHVTAVQPYGPSVVGVAFNVENFGTGTGQPNCTVIAAVNGADGGANGVVLGSISHRQFDYEAATDDRVTLNSGGANEVSIADGGVSVKCS